MHEHYVSWKNVFGFAGAFVAFLIGSGFATGQEVLQYFTSYGYSGLLAITVMFLLFLFVGGEFITTGFTQKFEKGSAIFTFYCGKTIGGFYDYFTIVFVFMSYVVMIAGAGATLNQHFGFPNYVGGVLMMCLASFTVTKGLGKIVDIIGKIGPLIVFISIVLGGSAIVSNPAGIPEGQKMISEGSIEVMRAGGHWFVSASSYVGFCMLWLAAFLSAMGKRANSKKEALLGSSIGAVGFTMGCIILMLGLLAHLPDVAGTQIPSLILAVKIYPKIATVFSIIIISGIYTTAVPLLWQVPARFSKEGTKRFKVLTLVFGVAGCVIGLALPFNRLVNIIYVINGYVGILLVLFIIRKKLVRR